MLNFPVKIIDRYVGLSVVMTAVIGVVVLSMVLVLGNLFKELLDLLINRDVPLGSVLMFMLYVLPFSLSFTIPWGFLTAVLLVFGRLSADNELIALRATGVSIARICSPVFGLAVLLTATCFYINTDVAPRAEYAATQAILKIATSNPASLFVADEVINEFPGRRIYVGRKNGDTLENLLLFEMDKNDELSKFVFAKKGELTSDPEHGQLRLRLFDARFEQRDKDEPRNINKIREGIVVKEAPFPISLDELYAENTRGKRASSFTLSELLEELQKVSGSRALELHVELNKRFSVSMACIAFALVAVPLGITAHRRETSVGFAFSLIIAFTYFFFIIMADTFRGNPNAFPVVLIWIPNLIFITLGAFLFRRLMKI